MLVGHVPGQLIHHGFASIILNTMNHEWFGNCQKHYTQVWPGGMRAAFAIQPQCQSIVRDVRLSPPGEP